MCQAENNTCVYHFFLNIFLISFDSGFSGVSSLCCYCSWRSPSSGNACSSGADVQGEVKTVAGNPANTLHLKKHLEGMGAVVRTDYKGGFKKHQLGATEGPETFFRCSSSSDRLWMCGIKRTMVPECLGSLVLTLIRVLDHITILDPEVRKRVAQVAIFSLRTPCATWMPIPIPIKRLRPKKSLEVAFLQLRMSPQPEPPLVFPEFPVRTDKFTVSKDLPGGQWAKRGEEMFFLFLFGGSFVVHQGPSFFNHFSVVSFWFNRWRGQRGHLEGKWVQ